MDKNYRQSVIASDEYPKNLIYWVIPSNDYINIFERLQITSSEMERNIEKAFHEIRLRPGYETCTDVNRSIQIVKLYFKDGVTIKEIGNMFNMPINTVKKFINHTINKLRYHMYFSIIITGKLGFIPNNHASNFISEDFADKNKSEIDFDCRDAYLRKQKYPRILYYDIFGYNIDPLAIPEDSIIQERITMALKEFEENSPFPELMTKRCIDYFYMHYRDGMVINNIASAECLYILMYTLRMPRYTYILTTGEVNKDYIAADRDIDKLGMCKRYVTALKKHNIYVVRDLIRYNKEELLKLRGIGKKCINEVVKTLSNNGFTLMPIDLFH